MPRSPRSVIALLLLAAAVAVAVAAVPIATAVPATLAKAKPAPRVADPTKEGRRLATRFFTLLDGTPSPALKRFLSPAFQLQRADGTTATRAEYLKSVANVKTFSFTKVRGTIQGGALVVTYTATTDQIIDGKVYKKDPAPRLSVFHWDGRAWRLIAHANFNTPVAS